MLWTLASALLLCAVVVAGADATPADAPAAEPVVAAPAAEPEKEWHTKKNLHDHVPNAKTNATIKIRYLYRPRKCDERSLVGDTLEIHYTATLNATGVELGSNNDKCVSRFDQSLSHTGLVC